MADGNSSSRRVLNNITAPEKDKKIGALKSSGDFVLKSFLPVSENCHFERYNYIYKNKEKLSIVYDTKAQIITLTGSDGVIGAAVAAFDRSPAKKQVGKSKPVTLSANGNTRTESAQNKKLPANVSAKSTLPAASESKKALPANTSAKNKLPASTSAKNKLPVNVLQKNSDSDNPAPDTCVPVKASAEAAETPEYKNGFAIKKCSPARMEGIVRHIAALKGVTVKSEAGDDGITTYIITEKATKQKCLLRYVVKKQSAQLQGKRSNLFGEVQVIISRDSDFGDAVESHMELTGEQMRTSAVQRSLKKLLPDAFDLLSEQSKIDLGIGMIDIGNTEVKLSDYSSLLVPPYRGLERFIYDLQQAHGITVKMIGQAYEKDEKGVHVLKACYRRKGGIVYSEVMSALYVEYFEKRNYYAHSDNTDFGQSRLITDKSAVKTIFDNLCAIINYNAKKLKETGFKIKQ